MDVSLASARTLREPRRVDYRALFGVFLTAAATAGSIAFWNASTDARAVVVATRELPAGAVLAAGDLSVSRVRVDEATLRGAVPAAERDALVGRTLAEPVHAHQLLARAQVAGRTLLGPDQVALTIPVGPETAVGARLRPGDAVRVLATTDRGKPESRTFVVVPRVTVSDLGREERGGVGSGSASGAGPGAAGRTVSITVICTPEQARDVAWARWNAELDFAVLPPEDGGGG